MDFQYSDEQTLLRDTTRDLLSRSYDAESRNKIIDTDLGWSRDVWSHLADTGILGLGFEPAEAGQIEIMLVMTEVGRRLALNPSCTPRWHPARSSPSWATTHSCSYSTKSPPDSDCWRSHTWNRASAARRPPCRLVLCGKVIHGT